jgi:transketolase
MVYRNGLMTDLARCANAIRALAMDAVEAANSGHPGMPMGMADVATVLFANHLKFDPKAPRWPDRDRFVLSAGHGSMLIYALLHLTGYEKPSLDDIKRFRQWHSPCAGHPENTELPGVECTTGPLGQGLAMSVGMAMAERHLNGVFGDALVDHHTWVVAGDGCLMEGISQEAISLAGHLKLGRLNVIWDDNKISIDGPVSLSSSEDMAGRFAAAGWHVVACDGHDFASIDAALAAAKADPRPSLIAARTTMARHWAPRRSKAPAPRWAGNMARSKFPPTSRPGGKGWGPVVLPPVPIGKRASPLILTPANSTAAWPVSFPSPIRCRPIWRAWSPRLPRLPRASPARWHWMHWCRRCPNCSAVRRI